MAGCRSLAAGLLVAGVLACGGGDGSGTISVNSPPVSVTGVTRDYYGAAPLASVLIAIDDHPTLTTTSGALGAYMYTISANTTLRAVAAVTNYRPTRNEPLTVGSNGSTVDLFAISFADVSRQYVAVSLPQTINTGVVIVNLVDGTGQPRVGIPVTDIVLLNAAQAPVGLGPYVFGSTGDIVPNSTLATTATFNGRSRVAFLDVPPGTLTLRLSLAGPTTLTTTVVVTANGATLVQR
jgi:hypothetical protein